MIKIDINLENEIKEYCKVNNILLEDLLNKILRSAFTLEKFGPSPIKSKEVECNKIELENKKLLTKIDELTNEINLLKGNDVIIKKRDIYGE